MTTTSRVGRLALFLALVASALTAARAAVIGVDLGGEYLKVSLVAPGRTPIAIALNEVSKRKTTAAVSFVNGERAVGEPACDMMPRSPGDVATRARDALGAAATSARVRAVGEGSKLAYATQGDDARNGAVRAQFSKGASYAVEELVAMTLEYAMKIGEDAGRGRIRDAVIAVPPFASQSHRRALRDAAEIAGLNVLAMKSDLSCAALQWGIDKEFPEPKWVIFVDVGSTSSGAALARYSSFTSGKVKKPHGQFELVSVKWDESVGGDALDMLLIDHFMSEFKSKHGTDLTTIPRAVGKMRKQVRKTKEILSANKEAPFSVESLHDEIDVRSKITRDEFTELSGDIFERMAKPLRDIVESLGEFNITLDDVEAIEVIGGSTRVPGVKEEIEKALNGRKFDVHLDADEAVAMGAGLFAANMSTTFRMRKFGAADAMPHGMSYSVSPGDDFTSEDAEVLVPAFVSSPLRRRVQLLNRTQDATFTVKLDTSNGTPLPPGTETDDVMTVHVTGVKEAMAKHNDTVGKMNVYFEFDANGVLDVYEAVYAVEVIDYVPEKPKRTPKPAKKPTATNATDANATEEAAANATETPEDAAKDDKEGDDVNATEATEDAKGDAETTAETTQDAEPVEEEAPKMKMRRRVFKTPLDVKVTGLPMAPMTTEQIEASIKVLTNLRDIDEAKRKQEAAKSNLEAYIYAIRGKLDEDDIQVVTTEEQRSEFKDELMDKEDWLYMDGSDSTTEVFLKTHAELKKKGDAIEFRAAEQTRRPAMVEKARAFIAKAKPEIESWPEKKPWLNETHVADLAEEVKQFEEWLNEKVEAQDKLAPTEDPTLESTEIKVSLRPIDTKFTRLKKKKQPKPPKVEQNATDANATDANATDANATDANATDAKATDANETDATDADADSAPETDASDGDDEKPSDADAPHDEL